MATKYLVIWWMQLVPHIAVFENRISAEAAAKVRNGVLLLVTAPGRSRLNFPLAVDYYRRDEHDEPMPFEWRDLGK